MQIMKIEEAVKREEYLNQVLPLQEEETEETNEGEEDEKRN